MSYCNGKLSQEISPNCENRVVGGIEKEGVIMNRSDIDYGGVVYDATRKNVIKTLALKTGAKAYKVIVPSNTPFSGTSVTMEAGTNRNTFTKKIGFVIFDSGPDVSENIIDGLATGEFVCILENKHKSLNKAENAGDSTFEVYGLTQGLKATTLENDKNSEDTEGGWNVELTETKDPNSGIYLFDTDIETTRAKVESLTA